MQQLLASYLLNAAWQVPIVALCAFAIARFAGLEPRARNRLWLGFLAVAAILPALPVAALLPHAAPTVTRVPADAPVDAVALAAAPHAAPSLAPAVALAPWAAWAMTGLFAAVALALTFRLLAAACAARRLVGQSRPVILPSEAMQAVERLARAHGRRVPPVRQSDRLASPAVVGALRPVILVPAAMAAEGEDLRAALLHEMAHVLRHDYAVNLVCEVLTLPVCWHPALLGLKAGVNKSREAACDAIAAAAMASPRTYARCLVSLAQSLGSQTAGNQTLARDGGHAASAALAVGLFGRSDLEERLMQLMTPRETEAPVLRAARICGLAALGAGLLGSAALLHVTPVFAQSQPARVTAAPLPAPAAAAAVSQAQHDAAKPDADAPPFRRHSHLNISSHGVLINADGEGYHHSFRSSDGREFEVTTDEARDLTPEEKRHWEDVVAKAEAHAAEAMKRVNSPEFKARIAAAKKAGAEAEARVNSPEFKARIAAAQARAAEAEARVNSPEFKARIAAAQARAAEAEARVNSPEFKAHIAAAQAHAAEVEKMVNSPEFKARIERATKAAARIDSPEFRARMQKMQADLNAMGDRIARQFDDTETTAP